MKATDANIVYVTGTDTNVGKTTIAVHLVQKLVALGINVKPLKPFCSGSRDDADALRDAVGAGWTIDEINPFHFRLAVAPLLAAERERKSVSFDECVSRIRSAARSAEILLVEGAGGLMSPLGKDYDLLRIIRETSGRSVLVAANRIGVINQVLMATTIMIENDCPPEAIVVSGGRPAADPSVESNLELLQRLIPRIVVEDLPWLPESTGKIPAETADCFLQKTLAAIMRRN